jgi:ABC-type multidrug transport system permease subunit
MMVRGFAPGEIDPIGVIPWRAMVLIIAAVLFFGMTVRGLGLVPSTFGAALLAAMASRRAGLLGVLTVSIGLTIFAILIFVVALSLNLRLIGPWIPV